jgi:hypothetical protein
MYRAERLHGNSGFARIDVVKDRWLNDSVTADQTTKRIARFVARCHSVAYAPAC